MTSAGCQPARGGDLLQRLDLGFAAQHRQGDMAGQHAAIGQKRVGAVFVKAERGRDRAGEDGEAARDQRRIGALRAHGGDQLAPARHQGDAAVQHLVDGGFGQARQQGDAGDQGLVEIQLSVHGAGGDGGDARADAGDIGQLVNAFLLDHGRIHVGQQHRLAPAGGRLDDKVEALRLQDFPDRPEIGGLGSSGNSAAMPGFSQITWPPCHWPRRSSTSAGVRSARLGAARMVTVNMGASDGWDADGRKH
jgi:hypothetical protein